MTRLRAVVPLLGAAVLAVIAVVTVREAGCDDPGRYVLRGGGYELVGGCIAPGDIVLPEPPATPPPDSTAGDVPARS
ncbi:hypothetical protein ACVGVM_24535 [Pseudonocardia bannensis]|uniref:Uncharacterized protein n=1 Tax=Pseudonocardia bannensis TaxID=630973 RepID=A0A848DLN9_9PSEU|nr:hypothetical protein [Pseudonocardia bannensis]NMH93690.1 hypothetical protein [Pseudonocardia bannensis]